MLVYSLIGLAALGVAGAAYFGFTFSAIEAVLAAIVFYGAAFMVMERRLRRRAENRLEAAIDELSRLLSTNAQAGAALSKRINAISEANPTRRLDGLEADMSVLGTVVRQVAETVAGLEAAQYGRPPPASPIEEDRMADPPFEPPAEPAMPAEAVAQALDQGRLTCHAAPIVALPQRRARAFDLVPRLLLEEGALAEAADFMPRHGRAALARRIDALIADQAIAIGRRVRAEGQPLPLNMPLSRFTLADPVAADRMATMFDADRTLAGQLSLIVPEAVWQELSALERAGLDGLLAKGVGVSIDGVASLRLDFEALAARGVRTVRVDAGRFLAAPETFTDFATADLAAYLARFDIGVVFTGIAGEAEIISLLEDGLTLVTGPHIAEPGPVRPDQMIDRTGPVAAPALAMRRAER